jgi:hypothetical protein
LPNTGTCRHTSRHDERATPPGRRRPALLPGQQPAGNRLAPRSVTVKTILVTYKSEMHPAGTIILLTADDAQER